MKLCSKCKKRPAVMFITRVEGDKTYPEGFCIKCAKELNIGPINDMLASMNISDDNLDDINDNLMTMMDGVFDEETGEINEATLNEKLDEFIPGGAATMPFLKNMLGNTPPKNEDGSYDAEVKQDEPKRKKPSGGFKHLNAYCTNLTAAAREGRLHRIIGREREMSRVIQIMSRRSKNNPCLIGEPGVGKTAIAEGIALRIANGDVPAKMMDN